MRNSIKQLFYLIFAPLGAYAPAGMFTVPHWIALSVSVVGIVLVFRHTAHITWEALRKGTRVFAILMTVLEAVKILYNFVSGYTWPDAWVPLSFCSLFLYSLWMAGYGRGVVQRMGIAFLLFGTVIGGTAFLLFPTTSLMNYPVWHFLCMYSMFYHSSMVCFGVLYLWMCPLPFDRKLFGTFALFFSVTAGISIGLNRWLGSNFMLLRDPYNIPFAVLHRICDRYPYAYTAIAFAAYLAGSGGTAFLVKRAIKG